ncbi:putative DAHP synthase, partial [Streptococcus mutans 66-2A]
MSFKATSDKINIEEMRSLSKLTGEALAQKEARDRELVSIIKGEDNR